MSDVAYIIGNGPSRKDFDLELLRGSGTIYGCNALYRDFHPDYLVAIDTGIIAEILASDFPRNRFIIPPTNEHYEPAECNPARPRSNAGMNAMLEALRRGATSLVCLGFDFLLDNPAQAVDNMYSGSLNYGPETKANHDDNAGRLHFLQWFITQNDAADFYFIFPHLTITPRPEGFPKNFWFATYETLKANLKDDSGR